MKTMNTAPGKRRFGAIGSREIGMILFMILLAILIQFRNRQFLTIENLDDLLVNAAIMGTLAIGMMMVIITGGIDLSLGATLALSGMTAALYVRGNEAASPLVAVLIGVGVGLLAGLINGLLVGYGEVLPLIATIGMMNVYRGLTYIIANGAWVSAHQMNSGFKAIAFGSFLGINSLVWVAIIVFLLGAAVLGWTRFGRMIYSVGSNPEAARVTGVNVERIKLYVYMIMGAITGLSGVLWVSKYASAQGDTAIGYEMNVIAACVLGGVSVTGGSGKVFGVMLGTILLGILKNALPLLRISPFWQEALYGLIILFAILMNTIFKRIVDRNNLQRRHI
jgi:rhamnose transport system permease protein